MTEGWKIGIVSLLFVSGIASHYFLEKRAVSKAVIVTQTRIEKEYQDKVIAANNLAAAQTKALNDFKANADKEKQDAVKTVDTKYRSLVGELQKRPTRADLTSSVASAVARAKSACTGAQLYREDGEFLAREAARADKVIIDRNYYYEQYEAARRVLAGEGTTSGLNGKATNTITVP